MANLNIKITESKKSLKTFIQFSCSVDIQEDILKTAREVYEIEIIQTGTIKTKKGMLYINFEMNDAEKVLRLKTAMHTFNLGM